MSVPAQRRPSYEGKVRRNANFVTKKAQVALCPKCKSAVSPHHACSVCGTYKGREVLKSSLDKKAMKKMDKKKAEKAEKEKEKEEKR